MPRILFENKMYGTSKVQMTPRNREEKEKKGKKDEQKEQQSNELQEGRVNKRHRDKIYRKSRRSQENTLVRCGEEREGEQEGKGKIKLKKQRKRTSGLYDSLYPLERHPDIENTYSTWTTQGLKLTSLFFRTALFPSPSSLACRCPSLLLVL